MHRKNTTSHKLTILYLLHNSMYSKLLKWPWGSNGYWELFLGDVSVPIWRWRGAMAGICLHPLCLPWVDVAAHLQRVGHRAIHSCPGGLILREVCVHVLCCGSGGCKESGTSVPGSFPIFPVPPPLSKLLCLVHGPGNSSGRADSEVTGGTGPPTLGGSSWTLSHGSILRANGCPSLGVGTEGFPPGDPSPGPCHFPERLLLYQKSALGLPVGVMGSCSGYIPYYLEGHDQRC